MTRVEKLSEAKRMRAYGLSYRGIAFVLEVSTNTIRYWCDSAFSARVKAAARIYANKHSSQRVAANKVWRNANRERYRNAWRDYRSKKREASIHTRISDNLRARLNAVIRRGVKTGSAVRDLGCTIEFFKTFISGKFQPEMSWENYGEWHLDHIKPLALFDLEDRQQFLEACHYANYQPLWAADNLRKGSKYADSPEFTLAV